MDDGGHRVANRLDSVSNHPGAFLESQEHKRHRSDRELDSADELPLQLVANLLPDDILLVELLLGLQEREARKEVILTKQFTELVEDVRVTEEVLARLGTVDVKRFLYVTKHHPKSILESL